MVQLCLLFLKRQIGEIGTGQFSSIHPKENNTENRDESERLPFKNQ